MRAWVLCACMLWMGGLRSICTVLYQFIKLYNKNADGHRNASFFSFFSLRELRESN